MTPAEAVTARPAGRPARPAGEAGVTLIETVVAMLVFGVFAAFAARLLLDTTDLAKGNTQRVVAASIAAQQVEQLRGSGTLALPDGRSVAADKPVIGGTEYTITRDVRFVSTQGGASACAGSVDTLAYKLVSVEVTWPSMGRIKPVRSDTLRTVGIGKTAADAKKGHLAVEVLRPDGTPQRGITVTVTPGPLSAVTGADGCVVFPNLATTSTYNARVDQFPYVGRQGTQAVDRSTLNIAAGKVTRTQFFYERRGAVAATPVAPTGYPAPSDLVVSMDASFLTPTTTRVFYDCASPSAVASSCVTGTPRTASTLYPGSYRVWPGACAMPSGVGSTTVTSDTAASASLALGGLQVVISAAGDPLRNSTLYAFRRAATGCTGTASYVMTALSPGERRIALPPGSWDVVTTADGTGTTTIPTQTVTAGAVTSVTK